MGAKAINYGMMKVPGTAKPLKLKDNTAKSKTRHKSRWLLSVPNNLEITWRGVVLSLHHCRSRKSAGLFYSNLKSFLVC